MFEKCNIDKKKLCLVNRIIRAVTGNKHLEAIKSKNDLLSAIISADDMETLGAIEENMNSLTIWKD